MSEEHKTSQRMKMNMTTVQSSFLTKTLFYINLGISNNENYYFHDC